MLVTTEAVVLRSMKYRETSKILTLYTREFGKLSVLAKGARGGKRRFGSALEPMSYVCAVLYKKESRDLQLLSHCDLVTPLRSLTDDLGKMAAAMGMLELLNAVSHDEERHVPLFELLVGCLKTVDAATKNPENALYFFETHLLDLLGFRPDLSRCGHCGGELEGGHAGKFALNPGQGAVYCEACAERGYGLERFTPGSVRVLRRLQEISDPGASVRIALSPAMRGEVGTMLRRFLQANVEGLRNLKSEAVFSALLA
jgi:DNA repair protein RecO (recombination protein O)